MSTRSTSISLPKERSHSILVTSMALFSMFFGAGNLIFPLVIGKMVGSSVGYAILGLGITAVLVPFLGLITMLFFQGSYEKFFGRIGRLPGSFLLFFLQFILGPFGVIPRLITLMYETTKPYLMGCSLTAFTAFFSAALFIAGYRRQKLIGYLGFLTPLLLCCITALVGIGLSSGAQLGVSSYSAYESFKEGLLGGYNTMDLIAAFVFATVILPTFTKSRESTASERIAFREILLPSLIAGSLLFFTYMALCVVAALHGASLQEEQAALLGALSIRILGPVGGFLSAMAVVLACFTTAMTLTVIFADFLKTSICNHAINSHVSLVLTLAIAAGIASLGFGGIAAFLGPMLQIIYPALIVLTLLNLFYYLKGRPKNAKYGFFAALLVSSLLFF